MLIEGARAHSAEHGDELKIKAQGHRAKGPPGDARHAETPEAASDKRVIPAQVSPHRLMEITRPAFEVTLDAFQYAGLITKRHKYENVIARPPA